MRAVVMLMLVAGCGDGIAAPDATAEPDAPRGLVTVKLVTLGSPNAPDGRPVYFQNADSSLVLATRTGLDGAANAFMAPGGFATIILGADIYTWFEVQPGDVLIVGGAGLPLPGTDPTSIRLSAPVDPGQQDYQLGSACGSSPLGQSPQVPRFITFESCTTRQDLLVQSYDQSFVPTRYLYERDVELDGSTHAMTGPYRPLEPWHVELRGVPNNVFEMTATAGLVNDGFTVFDSVRSASFSITDGAGTLTSTMFQPPGVTVVTMIGTTFGASGVGSPRVIAWGPPQASMAIDIAAIAPQAYTDRPTYLRGTHALRWAEAAGPVQASAVLATFGWNDFSIDGSYRWHVLAPRTADALLRLPRLPLPELTPADGAQLVHPYVFVNIAAPGGYAALRTRLPIDWTPGATWPIDGATGVVGIEELGTGGFEGRD